ncbi:MAG: PaaI family thioesterase [Candidatus Methanomethylophilaceae archaeon]|nr:PaaI family thioesterase [Candidatus Methanomethylophilaceae archaeon]
MAFSDAVIDPSLSEYMDRIEEMYNAPFVREIGIELVSMDDKEVRTRLELRPELLNSHGIGHGGVVYALADHTFAFATNIKQDATGQSATISYFRPATGKYIEAVSTLINDSRSLSIYRVDVLSDAGKLVASGMFTAFKIRRE